MKEFEKELRYYSGTYMNSYIDEMINNSFEYVNGFKKELNDFQKISKNKQFLTNNKENNMVIFNIYNILKDSIKKYCKTHNIILENLKS